MGLGLSIELGFAISQLRFYSFIASLKKIYLVIIVDLHVSMFSFSFEFVMSVEARLLKGIGMNRVG